VVASQKNLFLASKKWKMVFPCDEKGNFLLQHRKHSQDAISHRLSNHVFDLATASSPPPS
jgi:hypothetical protein